MLFQICLPMKDSYMGAIFAFLSPTTSAAALECYLYNLLVRWNICGHNKPVFLTRLGIAVVYSVSQKLKSKFFCFTDFVIDNVQWFYIDIIHVMQSWVPGAITIDLSHKFHDVPAPYPTMHHCVTEICTRVHFVVTKWCIVGDVSDVLWDFWEGTIP